MRLKNQDARVFLTGNITSATMSRMWQLLATHGEVSAENDAWELDAASEITDDVLNGLSVVVKYPVPGDILPGRVRVTYVSEKMVQVYGSSDPRAHRIVAELRDACAGEGLVPHESWVDAQRSLLPLATRAVVSDGPAASAAYAVSLPTLGAILAAAGFHGLLSLNLTTAVLCAEAGGLIAFIVVWRRNRRKATATRG